jgi:hypothetical protein
MPLIFIQVIDRAGCPQNSCRLLASKQAGDFKHYCPAMRVIDCWTMTPGI